MIDISEIRPGDAVAVRLTYVGLSEIAPDNGWRRLKNSAGETLAVHTHDFISHTPKALETGDRVRDRHDGIAGEVLAVFGKNVWVKWALLDNPVTEWLSNVERVDV